MGFRSHESALAGSILDGLEQAREVGKLRSVGATARAWIRHLP